MIRGTHFPFSKHYFLSLLILLPPLQLLEDIKSIKNRLINQGKAVKYFMEILLGY